VLVKVGQRSAKDGAAALEKTILQARLDEARLSMRARRQTRATPSASWIGRRRCSIDRVFGIQLEASMLRHAGHRRLVGAMRVV